MAQVDTRPHRPSGVSSQSHTTFQQQHQQQYVPFQPVSYHVQGHHAQLYRGGICFWIACGAPCYDLQSFFSHLLEAHNSLQHVSIQVAEQQRLVELETKRLGAMKCHYEALCRERPWEVPEVPVLPTTVPTVTDWSYAFNDRTDMVVASDRADAAVRDCLTSLTSSGPTHEPVAKPLVSARVGSPPPSPDSSCFGGGGGGDDGFAGGSDSSDSDPAPSRPNRKVATRRSLRSRPPGPASRTQVDLSEGSASARSASDSEYAPSELDEPPAAKKVRSRRTPQMDEVLPGGPVSSPVTQNLAAPDSPARSDWNSETDYEPPDSPVPFVRKPRGRRSSKKICLWDLRKNVARSVEIAEERKKTVANYIKISNDLVKNRELYKNSLDPPPYPVRVLIRQSIVESKEKKLSSRDILKWIQTNIGYYRQPQFHKWGGAHKCVQVDKSFIKCAPAEGSSAVRWSVDEKRFRQTKLGHKSLHMNQMIRHELSLVGTNERNSGKDKMNDTSVTRPPSKKLTKHVPGVRLKTKYAERNPELQKKLHQQVSEELTKDLEENGTLYKEKDVRPPFSVRVLIKHVIETSAKKEATLSEICDWLTKTYHHFREPDFVKRQVKGNLQKDNAFLKSDVKGGPWKVSDDLFIMHNQPIAHPKARVKKSSKPRSKKIVSQTTDSDDSQEDE